jgi:hypothetical protein
VGGGASSPRVSKSQLRVSSHAEPRRATRAPLARFTPNRSSRREATHLPGADEVRDGLWTVDYQPREPLTDAGAVYRVPARGRPAAGEFGEINGIGSGCWVDPYTGIREDCLEKPEPA